MGDRDSARKEVRGWPGALEEEGTYRGEEWMGEEATGGTRPPEVADGD